jgi:peptidoglycan/LPS O-acetylase OafA/YrhL
VPPLWTLHVEFWGSMLVLALASAHRRLGARGFGIVLALVLVFTGSSQYSLFVVGFVLHLLWRHRPAPDASRPELLTVPLIMVGVVLTTLPALPGMEGLLWLMRKLSVLRAQNATVLQSQLGAILIFVCVVRSAQARRWLSAAPLAWLGRLSFSIYLLHFAVMALIGSRTFLALSAHGYLFAGLISLVVGTAITFGLAIGFEKLIDQPAIKLATRVAGGPARRNARSV